MARALTDANAELTAYLVAGLSMEGSTTMASDVLPKASFRVILARQRVCVPFFAVMLFFGWLGFDHYPPADEQAFLMAVVYIPALVVAGFVGVRLLRRR